MAANMLGGLLMGGLGAMAQYKGAQQLGNLAKNQPSEGDLRGVFGKQQSLIDRMTNFGQYSGQAMDLASQQGNKGVEDAMMMGMGGSQANAIRNRMKRSSMAGVYDKFNQGLGQAAGLQGGIDQQISGQLQGQRDFSNQMGMAQASGMMGLGAGLLPEKGYRGLLGELGTGMKNLPSLFGFGGRTE